MLRCYALAVHGELHTIHRCASRNSSVSSPCHATQDGTVVIWTQASENDSWQPLLLHDFKQPVWRCSWSLTGNILAVSDASNSVTLWKEAVDGQWARVSTLQE